MLAFAGILLVLVAVLGGYVAEKGDPYVLLQPAELLIVCGSAMGIVLIANRPSLIRKMARGIAAIFFPPRRNTQSVLRSLRMLYELFTYAQRAGVMALESHVEEPQNSSIFSRYPELLRDRAPLRFLCDSWRMLVIGATTPLELDHLMDLDIEAQRRNHWEPVHALSTVADSLPGRGIVAAVLGVVVTMQSIGSSPETVRRKGGRGPGRDVPGNPALLWIGGPGSLAAAGAGGSPHPTSGASSHGHGGVCPRSIAYFGSRIWPAVRAPGVPAWL